MDGADTEQWNKRLIHTVQAAIDAAIAAANDRILMAEDFTGNRPLQERLSLLHHADFFIGLGSGLSWLAWAADTPVVMISGFSHPSTEFHTPYRVINFHS